LPPRLPLPERPALRILFVIRGKLGDSLIPYGMVRAYADAHPQDKVTLLIRKDYARLLKDETGLAIIPFGSRIEMMARLLWVCATQPAFDVLATLWGFGKPVVRIAQLVRAHRKIYLDDRHARWYTEWAPHKNYADLIDPAWLVTQVFAPDIRKPARLAIPSLIDKRRLARKPGAVCVIPAADEARRTFDLPTLNVLLAEVAMRHPRQHIWLVVNPADRRAEEFLTAPLPANVEIRRFANLEDLLSILVEVDAYYGTDTGVYHLAASMGVPATVLFGPTQPQKIVLPQQPDTTWVRLTVLGGEHCEVKDCTRPLCLYQCVASYAHATCATALADTPAPCPLRAFDTAALPEITLHHNLQTVSGNG
jgi:ADP-heptose:LPS heptosyltransferase